MQNSKSVMIKHLCKMVSHTLAILDIFKKRPKKISTPPQNAVLVTADVVGLYPSILQQVGLSALKEAFGNIPVEKPQQKI